MALEEISDRMEIQDLMVAYCCAIDNRDWNAPDKAFTPDAIIYYSEMVGVKDTLPEIKKFLSESMQQISATQHIITTSKIKVEGDRAHGRTICTDPMVLPDGHVFVVGLWYRDEFVRTPEGWRISSRYEQNGWRHNVPAGLPPEA